MLSLLSIRNIVLIDRLELEFNSGLTVLTGETGAGKSILLDAFSLALGGRGDGSLVRHREQQGQVSATFDLPLTHPVWKLAEEAGIEPEDQIILRRIQFADGRTRAFVNNSSVSVQTLKEIGDTLVEIHGQHADRALMDPAAHRNILDAFGNLFPYVQTVIERAQLLKKLRSDYEKHQAKVDHILKEADYLHHSVEELRQLNPQEGEETQLSHLRQDMMQAEKVSQDLQEAYEAVGGSASVIPLFSGVLRKLIRRQEMAPQLLDPVIKALDETLNSLSETQSILQNTISATEFDSLELERNEERLFALRATARKFDTLPDNLPKIREQFEKDLLTIEIGEEQLNTLNKKLSELDQSYLEAAQILSEERRKTSSHLSQAVDLELPPLKLEHARFLVDHTTSETTRDNNGLDRIEFWAQTNPGTRPGPLMKVASGGELSRFMLALKVVLADKGSAPTLIFDEIDSGVGGAVADAIGSRLRRLSQNVQVIAVTHAPQVAARANHHFLISKKPTLDADRVETKVHTLKPEERRDEIARMLAGAHITDEARAAATQLLNSENS